MNVLLLDDDSRFVALLSDALVADGHEVEVLEDVDAALRRIAATPAPDALIAGVALATGSGKELVRRLRGTAGGRATIVFLVQPFANAVGDDTEEVLDVDRVLQRPFSLLDVAGWLREARARRLGQRLRPPPEVQRDHLAQLARLWARGASGVLRVDNADVSAWVLLARGGPLDAEGLDAARSAVFGGTLSFDPCDVDGEGDSTALGAVLWHTALSTVSAEEAVRAGERIVTGNRHPDVSERLPLPPAAREALRHTHEAHTVTHLAELAKAPPEDVARTFVALSLLGLVSLTDARPPPRAAPPPAEPPTESAALVTDSQIITIRRLRKEVDAIRGADPWVTLGVPRTAPASVARHIARNMVARYDEFAGSPNASVRELATVLRDAAKRALDEVILHAPADSVDSPLGIGESEAFARGQQATVQGDWAAADRWFTMARDLNLDSARNLAHLGWSRFHNPDLPVVARAEEGISLLLLAEQLDPHYPDGCYFLATLLLRKGDDDGAIRRARRGLRAKPDHISLQALLRKLHRPPPVDGGS